MSAFDGKDHDALLVITSGAHPRDKESGSPLIGLGCCIVKDGLIQATYYAPGFSWDPPVIFADCCESLLETYLSPKATLMVHATGLAKRVRDVASSKSGFNSQGRRYAGLKSLSKLVEAHDAGRMTFRELDKNNFNFLLPYRAAQDAAKQGLGEAQGMASFMRTMWGRDPDYLATLQHAGNFKS